MAENVCWRFGSIPKVGAERKGRQMKESTQINVKGLLLDTEKNVWTAPKYWMHKTFGIGEMTDAVLTGECWVIVLNFGGEIRRIRQDKLTPYGDQFRGSLGKTLRPKKIEEDEEIVAPPPEMRLPIERIEPRRGSHRELSDEQILKMLRE